MLVNPNLLTGFKADSKKLVVVDLDLEDINFRELKQLKAANKNRLHLLGYVPLVNTNLIRQARKAEFDEVLTRSKCVRILPELITLF